MTATNHALTGAVIGAAIPNPLIAVTAAFLSHFLCDVIPHFGLGGDSWLESKRFKVFLAIDAMLCIALVSLLVGLHAEQWWLLALCAFLATSPDLLWLREFIAAHTTTSFKETRLERLLKHIQWSETPYGAVIEIMWAIVFVSLLVNLL